MTEPTQPPYFPRLCARLHAYEVDLSRSRITIWLASGETADMSGAIRFACRLDPMVRRIVTMSGDLPSTTFEKRGDGWGATGPVSLPTTSKEKE